MIKSLELDPLFEPSIVIKSAPLKSIKGVAVAPDNTGDIPTSGLMVKVKGPVPQAKDNGNKATVPGSVMAASRIVTVVFAPKADEFNAANSPVAPDKVR
jgi:hypothetical protein